MTAPCLYKIGVNAFFVYTVIVALCPTVNLFVSKYKTSLSYLLSVLPIPRFWQVVNKNKEVFFVLHLHLRHNVYCTPMGISGYSSHSCCAKSLCITIWCLFYNLRCSNRNNKTSTIILYYIYGDNNNYSQQSRSNFLL